MQNNEVISKSWFCVYNNPEINDVRFKNKKPLQILEMLKNDWLDLGKDMTGAWSYCISSDGLHHVHMVLERPVAMRFGWLKKNYCSGMHIEVTKGSKMQAKDYITKSGKYIEKGEKVVATVFAGDIEGASGKRSDLDTIQGLIDSGLAPREIFQENIKYRRYEHMIKSAYYDKRFLETNLVRTVSVHWLVGATGTGKSYTYIQLCEEYGEDKVFRVTDYDHPWDFYNGERILFLDEFRGGLSFGQLLLVCDVYKSTFPARYQNVYGLWSEVYIATPLLPQEVYKDYFIDHYDALQQLSRRITDITYFYFLSSGERSKVLVPSGFTTREELAFLAE